MKPIQKDELYEHLSGFLKAKGVELKEGSYTQTIQKSCSILADAINLGQKGIVKAKTGIDQKLDQMRQVIHEKTAPKSGPGPTPAPPPETASPKEPPKSKPKTPAAKVAPAKSPRKKPKSQRP